MLDSRVAFRVVIADDDEPSAKSLAELITLLLPPPLRVEVALDGHAALAAVERIDPHVAVLDINMPLLSGLEVAAAIRQTRPKGTPVLVAVTAHAQDGSMGAPALAGAFDHVLRKPVDVARLVDVLNRIRHSLP